MCKCQYKNCKETATTKGYILARDPNGGKDILTEVEACDIHKKVRGFLETK